MLGFCPTSQSLFHLNADTEQQQFTPSLTKLNWIHSTCAHAITDTKIITVINKFYVQHKICLK